MGRLRDKFAAINWQENADAVTHFNGLLSEDQIEELRHTNTVASAVIINTALAQEQLVYQSRFSVLWEQLFREPALKTQLF